MRYALALEQELDKDEILTRYLNIAYFGAGAYGIAAASQAVLLQDPGQADPGPGGPARRPGAVAGQRTTRSTATRTRRWPAGRTCWSAMVETGAITAGRRPPRREPNRWRCKPSRPRTTARRVPDGAQRLGLLLRLLHAAGGASQAAFGATADERRARAAPGRLHHRVLAGPGRRRPPREQVAEDLSDVQQGRGAAHRGGAAGHRAGAGDGGQPRTTAWPTNPAGQRELPEHRQPADRRRRRDRAATRPARRSRSSPCSPRWSPGLPLVTGFDAPTQLLTTLRR